MSRPQDKHLIPLTERSEEEAHAIRSAGGKAVQEKKRQQKLKQLTRWHMKYVVCLSEAKEIIKNREDLP